MRKSYFSLTTIDYTKYIQCMFELTFDGIEFGIVDMNPSGVLACSM